MPTTTGIFDSLRSGEIPIPPPIPEPGLTFLNNVPRDYSSEIYTGVGTTYNGTIHGLDYNSITYLSSAIMRKLAEVKGILELYGYNFITLAGGAPRDIYMNALAPAEAKYVADFDFFINCRLEDISLEKLQDIGFTNVLVQSSEDYEGDDEDINPSWVAKGIYKGLDINFIVHISDITSEDIINNFGCSLSKFELDLDTFHIIASKEARLSIASKTLVFDAGVSDNYKRKICSYFPAYSVGSYQQAAMAIVDREVSALIKTL